MVLQYACVSARIILLSLLLRPYEGHHYCTYFHPVFVLLPLNVLYIN